MASFESDRERLLATETTGPSSLYSESKNTSGTTLNTIIPLPTSDDEAFTPTARSTVRSDPDTRSVAETIRPTSYRGFPSEEAYLAALRGWAEERKYIHFDTSLPGWQGRKTMDDYANQPGVEFAWRTRMKERKAEKQRRATIANVDGGEALPRNVNDDTRPSAGRRFSLAFRRSSKTGSSPLTPTQTR